MYTPIALTLILEIAHKKGENPALTLVIGFWQTGNFAMLIRTSASSCLCSLASLKVLRGLKACSHFPRFLNSIRRRNSTYNYYQRSFARSFAIISPVLKLPRIYVASLFLGKTDDGHRCFSLFKKKLTTISTNLTTNPLAHA